MAEVSFFSENLERAYPFIKADDNPPATAVVDCGFIFAYGANADLATDKIYLKQLSRNGTTFRFEFRSTAVGLVDWSLTAYRQTDDPNFVTEFLDGQVEDGGDVSNESDYSDDPLACDNNSRWWGFVTFGDMERLAEGVDDGDTLVFTSTSGAVEPALLQDQQQSCVTAINVANADRTRATTPEGCKDYCWPFEVADVYVAARCIQGDVRLIAGYNCDIRQTGTTITLSAGVGLGQGEPCEELPLVEDEEAPEDYELLSGGPACDKVLRTINGTGARIFQLIAGIGATTLFDNASSRVVIDFNLRSLTTYLELGSSSCPSDSSDSSDSDDSCACGPE